MPHTQMIADVTYRRDNKAGCWNIDDNKYEITVARRRIWKDLIGGRATIFDVMTCGGSECVNPAHIQAGSRSRRNLSRNPFDLFTENDHTGCWDWEGGKNKGRGVFVVDGNKRQAHRVIYEECGGVIPPGHFLINTCDNRYCVNPMHMYTSPFTQPDKIKNPLSKLKPAYR